MKTKHQERFFSRVELSEACWLWTGSCDRYGKLKIKGHWISSHRASWLMFVGPIPSGMRVLHHCDVPRCVRPDHLFLGTQGDNMKDMWAKGRHAIWRGGRRARERQVGQ